MNNNTKLPLEIKENSFNKQEPSIEEVFEFCFPVKPKNKEVRLWDGTMKKLFIEKE